MPSGKMPYHFLPVGYDCPIPVPASGIFSRFVSRACIGNVYRLIRSLPAGAPQQLLRPCRFRYMDLVGSLQGIALVAF
jgi:hypothetical protein